MVAKIVTLTQPANPTIDQVFDEFLAEQRERLKAKTLSKYAAVLDLLRHDLNGYAYQSLSKTESALFDRHYNASGDHHREFCQLFGPDKIVENLGSFLGYFMIRKVVAGQDLMRAAGTVTKKLSKWLAMKGYVSEETAQEGAEEGAEAARDLPKAERAAEILADAVDELAVDVNELADEDYLGFDHLTIGKIEPGKLWLEVFESGKARLYGPISVPNSVAKLLRKGWDISCSLGRVRGKWRILEVANVYPG
ncbi:MAG: hypothetical protein V3U86_13175 [Acidobacteriota bacterium]